MNEQQTAQILKMYAVLLEHFRRFFKLATEDVQWVIQNPKKAIALFVKAIKSRNSAFTIWKTIKIGTGYRNAEEICQALEKAGCRISGDAGDIIGGAVFTISPEERELDLVVVSVADLGFSKEASRKDIYNRAILLGLELVPAETGLHLRLQYKSQLNEEWILMAMEPIKGSDRMLNIFYVGHIDDDFWLHTSLGNPEHIWPSDVRFVFALPRRS